jgi:hypothetical protein
LKRCEEKDVKPPEELPSELEEPEEPAQEPKSKEPFRPEHCHLPSESGECTGYQAKWFFNSQYGRCEQFVYTECGGNENRFDTEQECDNNCRRAPDTEEKTQAPPHVVG